MAETSQENAARRPRRFLPTFLVLGLILLAGIALRVRVFRENPGLYDDDGRLGVNILSRTPGELLLKPLGNEQAAPILYLMMTKQLVQRFGTDEWVLRLPALIASILALGLYVVLARQTLDAWAQGFALSLMALSWSLVEYSGRVKQYSGDVLMTVILMLLGVWALRQTQGRARFVVLAVVGVAMVGWSHPSVFVLGGIGSTLIGTALADRRFRDAIGWIAVSSCWFLVFVMCYLLVYRHYTGESGLLHFWSNEFAPFPPRSLVQFKWYLDAFTALFSIPLGLKYVGLAAAAFLFGVYLFAVKGQGRLLMLLVSPLILTLAASALHKYPFGDRLLLFACPLLATVVAAGIAGIKWAPDGPGGVLRGLIAVLLLIFPAYMGLKTLKAPGVQHDIKPALAYIADHWRDGDVMYANFWTSPLVDYYINIVDYRGLKAKSWLLGTDPGSHIALEELMSTFANDFDRLKGKRRVWVVFTKEVHGEQTLSIYLLDQRGVRLDEYHGRGSTAYLYDLSREGRG